MAEDIATRFKRARQSAHLARLEQRELVLRCRLHQALLVPVSDNEARQVTASCPEEGCPVAVVISEEAVPA